MATSVQLLLTLQELDDNEDTWGEILNVSTIELLEDAIAGMSIATLLTTSDFTMDATAGGDDPGGAHYRMMILQADGTPGGATNIIVPDVTNVYLVWNNTGDSSDVTVKTSGGTGILVPPASVYWVFCDATDVIAGGAATAETAATAAEATNALSLGGILAADYGPLAVASTWTAGQVTERVLAADDLAGTITCDLALANAFFHEMTGLENLAAPLNPTTGAQFSLVLEQGASPPHTLTFQANTFLWEGGVEPTLSTGLGDIDYIGFEYCPEVATTAKWVAVMMKGFS